MPTGQPSPDTYGSCARCPDPFSDDDEPVTDLAEEIHWRCLTEREKFTIERELVDNVAVRQITAIDADGHSHIDRRHAEVAEQIQRHIDRRLAEVAQEIQRQREDDPGWSEASRIGERLYDALSSEDEDD